MKNCKTCKWGASSVCENTNWKTDVPIDHSKEPSCGFLTKSMKTPMGFFPITQPQMELLLEKAGYSVKERDPKVKPEFSGAFMVIDNSQDPEDYAIVGPERDELVFEAYKHLLCEV